MIVLESKNCRKYLKRCYQLDKFIDEALVNLLDEWQCVEYMRFSSFSPTAKDTFKIHLEEYFMIHGILNDKLIYLILPPHQKIWIEQFEQKIKTWSDTP